jgi:hypothetical protein
MTMEQMLGVRVLPIRFDALDQCSPNVIDPYSIGSLSAVKCRQCVPSCEEGAIRIVNGKACMLSGARGSCYNRFAR